MNKKMRRMMREIERRGGMIHVNDSMPDDMAERFLQEVLNCPACSDGHEVIETVRRFDEPPIDWVLAGPAGGKSGH